MESEKPPDFLLIKKIPRTIGWYLFYFKNKITLLIFIGWEGGGCGRGGGRRMEKGERGGEGGVEMGGKAEGLSFLKKNACIACVESIYWILGNKTRACTSTRGSFMFSNLHCTLPLGKQRILEEPV